MGKKVVEYGHGNKPASGSGFSGGSSFGYGTPGFGSSFSSSHMYGDSSSMSRTAGRSSAGKTILYGHGKGPQTYDSSSSGYGSSSFGGGSGYGSQPGRGLFQGSTSSHGR